MVRVGMRTEAASSGLTKMVMRGAAKRHTRAEAARLNTREVAAAARRPRRTRSGCSAPVFWATKVEKALPKSWTGR